MIKSFFQRIKIKVIKKLTLGNFNQVDTILTSSKTENISLSQITISMKEIVQQRIINLN